MNIDPIPFSEVAECDSTHGPYPSEVMPDVCSECSADPFKMAGMVPCSKCDSVDYEASRGKFESTFPNLPRERTPSGMYSDRRSQLVWEGYQQGLKDGRLGA